MKTTLAKSLLTAAALAVAAFPATAQVYSTSLGAGNTNVGNFSLASGGYNTIYGGYGNHALGWSGTIGTGSFNFVTGLQNSTAGNFNFIAGASNAPAGGYNVFAGQNNVGTGSQNLVFGNFLSAGALNGSVILSDSNPFGIRTAGARFTNTTADSFTGIFNGGHRLRINSGQGANPNAGVFILPSMANTAITSSPAFVGINTAAPTQALDVVGNGVFSGDVTAANGTFTGGNLAAATGSFTSNVTAVNATLSGNLDLPTVSANNGLITRNGNRLLHTFPTGSGNTFVGNLAGNFTTTGTGRNTGVGNQALISNTTGSNNTAVGYFALNQNTSGTENSAIGDFALGTNTTGVGNTAFGSASLAFDSGNFNTAVGTNALRNNTTGGLNTAIGVLAGSNLTTGSNNICIGAQVSGVAGDSGTTRIGGGSTVATFISGISGVVVAGAGVVVDGAGQLGVAPSSRRFKDDIAPMEDASKALYELQPVSFRYKKDLDPAGTAQFGLIAEEVDRVAPELVVRDKEGKILTVRYEAVNAMLLNEFLKEHRRVDQIVKAKDAEIAALEARLGRLEKLLQGAK